MGESESCWSPESYITLGVRTGLKKDFFCRLLAGLVVLRNYTVGVVDELFVNDARGKTAPSFFRLA